MTTSTRTLFTLATIIVILSPPNYYAVAVNHYHHHYYHHYHHYQNQNQRAQKERRNTILNNKYIMFSHTIKHKSPLYKINYVCNKIEILDVYIAMNQHNANFQLYKARNFCKCYMNYYKTYNKYHKIRKLLLLQYAIVNCNRLYLDIIDAYIVYALEYFSANRQNKELGVTRYIV